MSHTGLVLRRARPNHMEDKMNIYTCTDHKGHYPVGVASVIIAENERQARQLLHAELLVRGLESIDFTLHELEGDKCAAYILRDGDY